MTRGSFCDRQTMNFYVSFDNKGDNVSSSVLYFLYLVHWTYLFKSLQQGTNLLQYTVMATTTPTIIAKDTADRAPYRMVVLPVMNGKHLNNAIFR